MRPQTGLSASSHLNEAMQLERSSGYGGLQRRMRILLDLRCGLPSVQRMLWTIAHGVRKAMPFDRARCPQPMA